MSKFEKLIFKLLSGASDKNFHFDDLILILLKIGFEQRNTGGSHKIFYKNGIEEILNIQSLNTKAKPYQVKQVRQIILKYKLLADE